MILFWLSGGPGHMETWDPKPEAPKEYRGPFGAISTNVAGVQFGELMPEQAGMMDKLAVLRTVKHGTGDHTKGNHWMLTGYEGPAFNAPDNRQQRRPSLGSAVARVARPESARHAGLCSGAAFARRHRQLLPLRGIPGRRLEPVRRQLGPERARISA